MKKLGKFIRNNIVGFILGAVIFSGVGAVIAGTVASNVITYTSNGQTTVEGALNDLYGKADLLTEYKNIYGSYWTDNYSNTKYASTNVPSAVYPSYTSIVTSGTNQTFIRTLYSNGSPTKHGACLYYGSTNKVLCLDYGYWESIVGSTTQSSTNGEAVKNALKTAMESALGTSTTTCNSSSIDARCDVGSVYCFASSFGHAVCNDGSRQCRVDDPWQAYCR